MKEKPINMTAEEVRAILDGRKSQFRRVIKEQPDYVNTCGVPIYANGGGPIDYRLSTFVQPGDRLWVRETFIHEPAEYDFALSSKPYREASTVYRADVDRDEGGAKWTPSIHMPRKLSRITLEIASVRVERLQGISEEDAKAEGIIESYRPVIDPMGLANNYFVEFARVWQSIHGPDSWAENPWVWVVEFRRLEGAQ